jgi:hypothetical protein
MNTFIIALGAALLAELAVPGIYVSFWATKVAPPSGVEVSDEGPCGPTVTIKTNVMPREADWFRADSILEIDETGKTIREWRIPIDYYPVGVEGDKVLLAYGSSPQSVLSVDLAGRLTKVEAPPKQFLKDMECPAPHKEHRYCAMVSTNPVRMIAAEPVCT